MSDWILIPSLVSLRMGFNKAAPNRRKGADGSIGDSNHASSSDHTPDEDSNILRDHDADTKNEVHALDIDSAGPWPDGKGGEAGGWFDRMVKAIWAADLARGSKGRLQYVIWRGQIANRDIQKGKWRTYTSKTGDLHYNHAHFSGRYTTAQEQDESPWGFEEENDMELTDKLSLTPGAKKELGGDYAKTGVVDLSTAYNLLLIYTARANDNAAAAVSQSNDNAAAIADLITGIKEIRALLGVVPGKSDADVATALRAALGDRAPSVGALLTANK